MDVRTRYREDLSRGVPWRPGDGRFLVITVTRGSQSAEATLFEADDGTHFIVAPARSREEADAKARASAAGAETRTFAVRPRMSMPAREWIDGDPAFWQAGSL